MRRIRPSGVTGIIATVALLIASTPPHAPSALAAPDHADAIAHFSNDVYVIVAGALVVPVGLCSVTPCPPGETLPDEPLFNVSSTPLGLTWGEFLAATASSRVSCHNGETSIRIDFAGLIPQSTYSVFYRTFGPDSINPVCPTAERSLVVPGPCKGSHCQTIPADSRMVTDATGEASFSASVDGCLFDASQLLFDVIYHFDGSTYGALPNRGEFESCHSSFGADALRQLIIVQKLP